MKHIGITFLLFACNGEHSKQIETLEEGATSQQESTQNIEEQLAALQTFIKGEVIGAMSL